MDSQTIHRLLRRSSAAEAKLLDALRYHMEDHSPGTRAAVRTAVGDFRAKRDVYRAAWMEFCAEHRAPELREAA